jgi:hypothetical protein
MKSLIAGLLAIAALAQPAPKVFTGTITDSMCRNADHAPMRMGPTDAECAKACAEEHDATFVLYDGKQAYELIDQKAAGKFAGQKVRVTGTVDAKTKAIHVTSMAAVKP